MNLYAFNPEICPGFLNTYNEENNDPFAYNCNEFTDISGHHQPVDETHIVPYQSTLAIDPPPPTEVPEIPDTCFNYITNVLREEYSDDSPSATLQDYMAAQLCYSKSLDAALVGENSSFSTNHHQCPPVDLCQASRYCLDDYLNMFSSPNNNHTDPYANAAANHNIIQDTTLLGNITSMSDFGCTHLRNLSPGGHTFEGLMEPHGAGPVLAPVINGDQGNPYEDGFGFITNGSWGRSSDHQGNMGLYSSDTLLHNPIAHSGSNLCVEGISRVDNGMNHENLADKPRGRKHGEGNVEEEQGENHRRNKHLAPCDDVSEQIEEYGDVILCPEGRSKPGALCSATNRTLSSSQDNNNSNSSKGSKKRGNKGQVADLRGLLTRCAQCVARVDLTGAYEMLHQIRQHSSPYGDFLQRVAHYLANGLEARLEGRGLELALANEEILTACDVLKANRVYVASTPFQIMSYYTTNKTIARLVEEAPSIHIIDFGIFHGLQWPCIIQNLSKRPNGPPKIRITGVDFPLGGFRPSERVEETGRCLAKYCERYNVGFEYNGIAKKWEDVQVEELKIERTEPLVVNCLYRAHHLLDESVEENSPRDAFLSLVRKINPDIFMHGVVNSTLSVPFFLNRFKEAMFHYSALFDVFEATMSREDSERMLLESKLYGKEALNVIACEGVERVERPESYKQWQVRTLRAGFEQLPLDRELLRRARAMVKRSFRQEFSYDEDGFWVVQGWKGRILYAISCWKPA